MNWTVGVPFYDLFFLLLAVGVCMYEAYDLGPQHAFSYKIFMLYVALLWHSGLNDKV